MKKIILLIVIAFTFVFAGLKAQVDLNYQTPPKALADLVDAPQTPSVSMNLEAGVMLLMERPGYPDINDLSQEMLRLGGMRIDPAINGSSRPSYYTNITLVNVDNGEEKQIKNLPTPAKLGQISWSPKKDGFVFTHIKKDGIDLYYVALADLTPRLLLTSLNSLGGSAYNWMPNGQSLICKTISDERGAKPSLSAIPTGPIISQNLGTEAASRTYQDLLKNKQEEALFKYLLRGKLVKVDLQGGKTEIGGDDLYRGVNPSPDGQYLMVSIMKEPFSYLVPYYRFPYAVELWNASGEPIKTIHEFPLMESIPKGSGATQPGPRSYSWRADVPASLYWVEALDKGDPKVKVPYRDVVFQISAPFLEQPTELLKTKLRYSSIRWGRADLAVVTQSWRSSRQEITSFFNPSNPSAGLLTIWDRSSEGRYDDPGSFINDENKYGRSTLLFDAKGKKLYLSGSGASPKGNYPFLDEFTIKDFSTKRLWQSEDPYYETVTKVLDIKKLTLLTSRQSQKEPSNYFIRDLKKKTTRQISFFKDPYPFMQGVNKQMITYTRNDGVLLNATLYTPAGWTKEDGPLPTLLWAYPREFKSKKAAGQISGSPNMFTRLRPTTAVPFVTQGYAIIDGAAFPIIGEGDVEPNDYFIEQLVANGKAAIDKAAEMGVTDPKRVAVGGHSYGAFMTANLLAHCDYFATGIARSGAYNRTLTPFGFQSEPRTFWEAPEIYFAMSPFMHAQKVNEPILMIHGVADNNSGTFPMQSERFYNALKGHGGTARLVMLPLESHGYVATESLKHMLWEQATWLKKYLAK